MKNNNFAVQSINLLANQVREVQLSSGNVAIVKNPSSTNIVYLGFKNTLSATDYETIANINGFGVLAKPGPLGKVYLLASSPVTVEVRETFDPDPLKFYQTLVSAGLVSQISVTSTVGLKPSDLNIDVSKNLGVVNNRTQTTIKTHNNASIPASGNNISGWYDTQGYDQIAINLLNDASADCSVDLYWSTDGITIHGNNGSVIPTGAKSYESGITDTKARYVKVRVNNRDSVSAHTFNVWAYLKN